MSSVFFRTLAALVRIFPPHSIIWENSSPTGAITLALASNSRQEATFNDDVTAQDALIATQQASLTTELNTANEVLQAIPEQLDEMNELYSAMTGYNTGTNG